MLLQWWYKSYINGNWNWEYIFLVGFLAKQTNETEGEHEERNKISIAYALYVLALEWHTYHSRLSMRRSEFKPIYFNEVDKIHTNTHSHTNCLSLSLFLVISLMLFFFSFVCFSVLLLFYWIMCWSNSVGNSVMTLFYILFNDYGGSWMAFILG